jgi:hypothetical protein
MLVTFRSNAGGNITMFGDVAVALLKMMGHSGTVPSALLSGDIPAALVNLNQALAVTGPGTPSNEDPDASTPVSLQQRAYPLIQLLSASAGKKSDVMWQEGQPGV